MFNDILDYPFWFKFHALVFFLAMVGAGLILGLLTALHVPLAGVSVAMVVSLAGCLGGFGLLIVGLCHRQVVLRELWRGMVAYALMAGILLSLTYAAVYGL